SERSVRPSRASAATSSWSCAVGTPRSAGSSSSAASARAAASDAASRIARDSSPAASGERESSRSKDVIAWNVRMSSLSRATTTRSARCACSARANAVRRPSAAATRSATRPAETAESGSGLSPRPTTRRRPSSRRATTTCSTPAERSTPATAGPRVPCGRVSRAWVAGLAAVTSSVQTLADPGPCRLDRFIQPRRVLPAGLGAFGPPAAASGDDALDLLDELVRVERGREVLRDGDDEEGVPFPHATQDYDPRADPRADAVREGAELIHAAVADVGGDDASGPDRLGLREQAGRRGLDPAALPALELALELFALLQQLRDGLGDARRRNPQQRPRAAHAVAHLPHLADRAHAGDGLDAPHAGADALLLRDDEGADVAGAVAVRPAAELAARPRLHDAHDVVVLLAEERHRARRERVLQRHDARPHVRVLRIARLTSSST